MKKLERLLNLTAVLLDTERYLTADQLRNKVEGYPEATASFRRAFERDKEDLRVLGIPLKVERVPGTDPPIDGYRIPPEDYYLPDPGLEPDELAALHLASMMVKLEGLGDGDALAKLGGQLGEAAGEGESIADSVASLPNDPNLVPLFSAITGRIPVQFVYNDQSRVVEPRRLDFQRGRWYLTAYDRFREGDRNFRIERIPELVELLTDEERFERESKEAPGRRIQGWELGDRKPVLVELLIDESRVATASQQFGPDVERRSHSSGGTVFVVPVVNEQAFRSFALGFLEHAEILSPPEIRAGMTSWLSDLAAAGEGS